MSHLSKAEMSVLPIGVEGSEVECIARGKTRARYEFGVKTSVAVTNARGPGGQFVFGARPLPGNPHDGHSLAARMDRAARHTGREARRVFVDRGYRGHGVAREGPQVVVSHTCGLTSPAIRGETDGLLERNHPEGHAVNAILRAVGHDRRLLPAWFGRLLACLINTSPGIRAVPDGADEQSHAVPAASGPRKFPSTCLPASRSGRHRELEIACREIPQI